MDNATGAKGAKDSPTPLASAVLVAGPDLRLTLAKIIAKQRNCSIDDVSDGHILAQAENAAALQGQIDELMAGLGAKTLAEALAKMQAADELKAKLNEALQGKASAEGALQEQEDDMMQEDVGMALASLGITDASKADKVKKALLAERGKAAETIAEFRKTYDLAALKKAARERLLTAAQETVADRTNGAPAHLTASIATTRQTPTAAPQEGVATVTMGADGSLRLQAPRSSEAGPAARAGGLTLSTLQKDFPHEPNDFLRKVAFVKAQHAKNNPTATPLTHDQACEHAHEMRLAG